MILTSVVVAGDYELPVRDMTETNLNWHVDKDNEEEAGEKKGNTLLLRIERGKLARVRFVLPRPCSVCCRCVSFGFRC